MTKAGRPCQVRLVNAAGYCIAHDPERPANMRELGRKSGEARRRPHPERVPESLRDELRNLDPAVVRAAIEKTLAGGNESARVSAVKLLADVDAFRKDTDECPRCAARKAEAEGPAARDRVNEWIARLVEGAVRDVFGTYDADAPRFSAREREARGHDSQAMRIVREAVMRGLDGREGAFTAAVETAVDRVLDAISNGLVVGPPVDEERAADVLRALEELGLVAGRERIEEMARQRAEEMTRAFREEHGLPMTAPPPVAA